MFARRERVGVIGAVVAVLVASDVALAGVSSPQAQPPRHLSDRISFVTPQLFNGDTNPGIGTTDRGSCSTSGDPAAQIDINCDGDFPDKEFAIVADSTDPQHLLAGSNDVVAQATAGTVIFTPTIGTFTSFDGGATWTDSQLPNGNSPIVSDPAPAIDAKFHTSHMGYIGYSGGKRFQTARVNLNIATSHDGGLTWDRAVTVAQGTGSTAGVQVFNDKPWVVADNNPTSPFYGRLYALWTRFLAQQDGYNESPIFLSSSFDGGSTWSTPHEISGSDQQFCFAQVDQLEVNAGQDGQYDCDQDQNARATVAGDGTLYVSFTNFAQDQLSGDFDDQLMVVRSIDGGATFTPPVHVVRLQNGLSDYPFNYLGFQTLTGHQFRVVPFFAGNIASDTSSGPNSGRVYIAYMDNEGISGPAPVTNTNIFLAYSDDGGQTWTGGDSGTIDPATRIRIDATPDSDQFFAAVAVDPTDGDVDVLYLNGRPDRTLYDTTLATAPTDLSSFTFQELNDVPSNPNNARFFRARVADCFNCADFIGDYIGLDVDALGRTHAIWDQLSRSIDDTGLFTDDAYYARR